MSLLHSLDEFLWWCTKLAIRLLWYYMWLLIFIAALPFILIIGGLTFSSTLLYKSFRYIWKGGSRWLKYSRRKQKTAIIAGTATRLQRLAFALPNLILKISKYGVIFFLFGAIALIPHIFWMNTDLSASATLIVSGVGNAALLYLLVRLVLTTNQLWCKRERTSQ